MDLSVERLPGSKRLVSYERGTGEILDCSKTPAHAYWPSETDFRKPGPVRPSGLGIMPLTSYTAGSLHMWAPAEDFENALKLILSDRFRLTHLAFVVRTNIATSDLWENFQRNADTLARLVRDDEFEFQTATAAWLRAREWLGLVQ